MAGTEYEYNGDLWFYKGHEYQRGDTVAIADDLDDDHQAFIDALVDAGTLVEPGHAEKLRKEQEKADEEQAEWEAEQVERNDREAHRRVDLNERRLTGGAQGDNEGSDAASDAGEKADDKSKPAARRTSSSSSK